jgi:hypothetical protein
MAGFLACVEAIDRAIEADQELVLIRPTEGQAGGGRPFLLFPVGGSRDAHYISASGCASGGMFEHQPGLLGGHAGETSSWRF